MKIESIDVEATIKNTRTLLENDPDVSPALRSSMEVLLMLVTVLINQLGLNSQNSSKPPSSDPNRKRKRRQQEPARPEDKKVMSAPPFENLTPLSTGTRN